MLFEAMWDGDAFRIERAEVHLELCVTVDELCCAQLRKEAQRDEQTSI